MFPYLLLFTISAVTAQSCDYRYDNRLYSRRSLLNTDYDEFATLPTNLVYDSRNNELLFTLATIDSIQDDDEGVKTDEYIYRKGKSIKIENVKGEGRAAAVDLKNGIVYIASNRGLHILNGTDKATYLSHIKSMDIVQLMKPAHRDELYVVTLPEYKVTVLNLKTITWNSLEHIPYAFILAEDSHGNIFHVTESKDVEVLLKGFSERALYEGLLKDTARAIAVDEADRAILAADDGLYHLRADNVIPKKMMNLDFVPSGIAFHNGNIFLSTHGTIYEFSPCH